MIGEAQAQEQWLHRIPLFDGWSEQEKRQIESAFRPGSYRMGETVIQQGERSRAFYLIVSGKARTIGTLLSGQEANLGLMGEGEHFGEQSLLKDEPSEVTVAASTDLKVMELEREAFANWIGANPELARYFSEYMASVGMRLFLQKSTILAQLSAAAIRSLLDSFEVRSYVPGELLVCEGDPGDAFYILRTGSASVLRGEQRLIVNKLLPGDYFGELALLTREVRKATVMAEQETTAYRLGQQEFDSLIERFPMIRHKMERMASYYSEAPLVGVEEESTDAYDTDRLRPHSRPRPSSPARTNLITRQSKKNLVSRIAGWFRRRYPALMQQSEMDCGPTCLTMIVRYYGGRISLNRMRRRVSVTASGTTLQGLSDTAAELGLEATGVKIAQSQLRDLQLPCLLHWGGNHYIVLYRVLEESVILVDPAVGVVEEAPLTDLQARWNGIALQLRPVGDAVRKLRDEDSVWAAFLPFLKPHSRVLAGILGLSIAAQLLLLTLPVLTQVIVDRVLAQRKESLLQGMLAGLLLLACGEALTTFARQWLVAKTALRLDMAVLGAFYRKLFSLPYDFFVRRTIGDIMTRVGESEKIRRLLTDHAIYLLLDGLTLLLYGGVMFVYNVKLALLSIAFLPLFAMMVAILLPRLRRNSRKQFIAEGESQSQLVETVHAIATVKALAAERIVREKLEAKLSGSLTLRIQGFLLGASADAISGFLQVLGSVVLLYAGSRFVLAGELSVGELVAFTGLFMAMLHAVDSITKMLDFITEARISMERMNDIFEAEQEQPDPQKLRMLPAVRGHIQFENVAFRYEPGGANILQNLTFEIKPGQTVAMVGRSGSGKTTFINLLLKLFEPTEGTITVDGVDLRQVHAGSLRRQVGVVQQETFMFRASIRDNIAFHHPQANDEEVEAAAKLAGAHEFISRLPLGYDTMIGEGGIRLSGGQRQRISIARALIGSPRLLIFDEATSALDTESEAAIQRNMEAILQDRSAILIAHRLSTIRRAHRIFVLDQGTIVESGTHEELLRSKGLYAHLVGQQVE